MIFEKTQPKINEKKLFEGTVEAIDPAQEYFFDRTSQKNSDDTVRTEYRYDPKKEDSWTDEEKKEFDREWAQRMSKKAIYNGSSQLYHDPEAAALGGFDHDAPHGSKENIMNVRDEETDGQKNDTNKESLGLYANEEGRLIKEEQLRKKRSEDQESNDEWNDAFDKEFVGVAVKKKSSHEQKVAELFDQKLDVLQTQVATARNEYVIKDVEHRSISQRLTRLRQWFGKSGTQRQGDQSDDVKVLRDAYIDARRSYDAAKFEKLKDLSADKQEMMKAQMWEEMVGEIMALNDERTRIKAENNKMSPYLEKIACWAQKPQVQKAILAGSVMAAIATGGIRTILRQLPTIASHAGAGQSTVATLGKVAGVLKFVAPIGAAAVAGLQTKKIVEGALEKRFDKGIKKHKDAVMALSEDDLATMMDRFDHQKMIIGNADRLRLNKNIARYAGLATGGATYFAVASLMGIDVQESVAHAADVSSVPNGATFFAADQPVYQDPSFAGKFAKHVIAEHGSSVTEQFFTEHTTYDEKLAEYKKLGYENTPGFKEYQTRFGKEAFEKFLSEHTEIDHQEAINRWERRIGRSEWSVESAMYQQKIEETARKFAQQMNIQDTDNLKFDNIAGIPVEINGREVPDNLFSDEQRRHIEHMKKLTAINDGKMTDVGVQESGFDLTKQHALIKEVMKLRGETDFHDAVYDDNNELRMLNGKPVTTYEHEKASAHTVSNEGKTRILESAPVDMRAYEDQESQSKIVNGDKNVEIVEDRSPIGQTEMYTFEQKIGVDASHLSSDAQDEDGGRLSKNDTVSNTQEHEQEMDSEQSTQSFEQKIGLHDPQSTPVENDVQAVSAQKELQKNVSESMAENITVQPLRVEESFAVSRGFGGYADVTVHENGHGEIIVRDKSSIERTVKSFIVNNYETLRNNGEIFASSEERESFEKFIGPKNNDDLERLVNGGDEPKMLDKFAKWKAHRIAEEFAQKHKGINLDRVQSGTVVELVKDDRGIHIENIDFKGGAHIVPDHVKEIIHDKDTVDMREDAVIKAGYSQTEITKAFHMNKEQYAFFNALPADEHLTEIRQSSVGPRTMIDRFLVTLADEKQVDLTGKTVGEVLRAGNYDLKEVNEMIYAKMDDSEIMNVLREQTSFQEKDFMRSVGSKIQRVMGMERLRDIQNIAGTKIEFLRLQDAAAFVPDQQSVPMRVEGVIRRATEVFGPEIGEPRPGATMQSYFTRIAARAELMGATEKVFPSK